MSLWETWKVKNAEKQAQGKTSPVDFLNAYTEYADETTAENRLKVCEECPHLMVTKQCSECLCFMPAKVKLLHAVCPKGLW